MVFSSYIFLFVFLPAVLLAYYGIALVLPAGWRASVPFLRTLLLIVASYVFYGWERYAYVFLILASTLVDLILAHLIARSTSRAWRRAGLVASIATNLGLLGFFKYRNFAVESVNAGLSALGFEGFPPLVAQYALPVGISFYTFQSMSYTIDVYRGVVPAVPLRRSLDFVCFVSLFPQLVAGPIVRFREIRDQLVTRVHSLEKFACGVFVFAIGFAKKTLIANHVGMLADALFSTARPSFLDAWIGMLGYSFQIYFDFSGYSDMAIGLGLMIGFTLPINFESPYKAESITDFWRRWHISLSTWLRDYLYVPLGGNRRGRVLTYRNLLVTMLLGGIWHGAAWTFVLWGAFHGVLLALERVVGKRSLFFWSPRLCRQACTFLLVLFGWTLFRAESMAQLGEVLGAMLRFWEPGELVLRPRRADTLPLLVLVVAAPIAFFGRTTQDLARNITPAKAILALVLFAVGVQQMLQSGFNPFLYFQF